MKNFKKLVPAFLMLLLSASMMGTSTYAWFSLNTKVNATNMEVIAVAEQGILINEVATASDTHWDDTASTNQTEGIPLRATSTSNTSTWYVAFSKRSGSSASASSSANSEDLTTEGYKALGTTPFVTATETVAAVAGTNAQRDIIYVDKDGSNSYQAGEGFYVKYTYYIKSSADAITLALTANAQNLNVVEPTVTGNSGSADLDKSLRVAVVVNNKAYIYAPLNSSAGTYYVGTNHTATTPLTGNQATSLTSIPATTADGVPVYVYMWFEGEDTNLKTDNITTTLDNLTVSVGFELVTNDTAATDNGVAVN